MSANTEDWVRDSEQPPPAPLLEVVQQIQSGAKRTETVRTLLAWFGQQRRGTWVTQRVQAALADVGLRTEPDFTSTHIDASVQFLPLEDQTPSETSRAPAHQTQVPDPSETQNQESEVAADAADPVPRISLLKAANKGAVTVSRDASVQEAVTLMLLHDYSQLPVMSSKAVVGGLFSWKTLGEARTLGRECKYVRDCMDSSPLILLPETPLLDAVVQVAARDVAIIYDRGQLHGIITTSDLSLEFHASARPFLLLGSIENNLRAIVSRFDLDTLRAAKDPADESRAINGPDDLTFGEYLRLLQRPANWNTVSQALDRASFVAQLERVRNIRNDVMHFHPDPLEDDKLAQLDATLRALQMLRTELSSTAEATGIHTSAT